MSKAPEQSSAPRRATCPICKKEAVQTFRPFCSKRCADIDLGKWLSNHYALPVEEDWDEDGDRPAPEAISKTEPDAS